MYPILNLKNSLVFTLKREKKQEFVVDFWSPSHVQHFVTQWTVAHQISLSMEFSRKNKLEWVAIFHSRVSSLPRDQNFEPAVPVLAGGFFTS